MEEKMKKKVIWLGLGLLTAAAMLLASCGTSSETTSMTTTSTGTSTTGVVLTVTNGSTTKTYTLAELQALQSITGKGGTLISGLSSCQGVAVMDLLNAVGGISSGESITINAAHSYTKTLTYDQVVNSNFNYYDVNGNTITPTVKPVLTAIYFENGFSLSTDTVHGPVQLGIISDQNLATDAGFWLDNIKEIDIIH
jgi:hypothetical protein